MKRITLLAIIGTLLLSGIMTGCIDQYFEADQIKKDAEEVWETIEEWGSVVWDDINQSRYENGYGAGYSQGTKDSQDNLEFDNVPKLPTFIEGYKAGYKEGYYDGYHGNEFNDIPPNP